MKCINPFMKDIVFVVFFVLSATPKNGGNGQGIHIIIIPPSHVAVIIGETKRSR